MCRVSINKWAFLDLLSTYSEYLDNLCVEYSDGLRLFSNLYEDHIITYPFRDYDVIYSDGVYSLFCLSKDQISDIVDYLENLDCDYFNATFSNHILIVSYDAPDDVLIDYLEFKD